MLVSIDHWPALVLSAQFFNPTPTVGDVMAVFYFFFSYPFPTEESRLQHSHRCHVTRTSRRHCPTRKAPGINNTRLPEAEAHLPLLHLHRDLVRSCYHDHQLLSLRRCWTTAWRQRHILRLIPALNALWIMRHFGIHYRWTKKHTPKNLADLWEAESTERYLAWYSTQFVVCNDKQLLAHNREVFRDRFPSIHPRTSKVSTTYSYSPQLCPDNTFLNIITIN